MTQQQFESAIEADVQQEYTARSGNLAFIVQDILGIELTPTQQDILNNWWVHNKDLTLPGKNWVDLLFWLVEKLIEWIVDLFD